MLNWLLKLATSTKLSYFLAFFASAFLATFLLFQHQSSQFYQLSRKGLDNVDWTYFQLERTFDGIRETLESSDLSDDEKKKQISVKWDLFSSAIDTAQGPSFNFLISYVPKSVKLSKAEFDSLKKDFAYIDNQRQLINKFIDEQGWDGYAYAYLRSHYKELYLKIESVSLRANQRTAAVSSDKQKDLDDLEFGVNVTYFAQAFIILMFTLWGVAQIKTANSTSLKLAQSNTALKESNLEIEESREKLMAAFKDRSLFIAKSSHELRTPLNAILGFIDLTLDHIEDNSPQKNYLQQAHESAKHLLLMTEDILQFSKLESLSLTINSFDLKELIESYVAMMYAETEKNNFSINLFMDSGILVNVDAVRLKQIILNLINNAIKYAGEGQSLTIFTQLEQNFVRVSFSDSGPGVPAAVKPILFTPFTRGVGVDSAIPGTGLGLSTSLKLATSMGGSLVLVDSEIGARFDLTLPLTDAHSSFQENLETESKSTEGTVVSNCDCPDMRDIISALKSKNLAGVIILGLFENPDLHDKINMVLSSTEAQYMLVPDWEYVQDIYSNDGSCWILTDYKNVPQKNKDLYQTHLLEINCENIISRLCTIEGKEHVQAN